MGKAIFFAKLIIITGLMPIFAFQKVEGKLFSPLSYTLIGFIALFGICIQDGVLLITVFKHNLEHMRNQNNTLYTAIKLGVNSRIRPVMMTALMAAIGLFRRPCPTASARKAPGPGQGSHRRYSPRDDLLPAGISADICVGVSKHFYE